MLSVFSQTVEIKPGSVEKKYVFDVDGFCDWFQQHLPGLHKMSLAQRNE
jgi:hypothetical protein